MDLIKSIFLAVFNKTGSAESAVLVVSAFGVVYEVRA